MKPMIHEDNWSLRDKAKDRYIPTTDYELIALCDNQSQRQRKRHGYVVMRDRPGTFMAWVRAEVVERMRRPA